MLVLNETALDGPGEGSSVVVCFLFIFVEDEIVFPRCVGCSSFVVVMFSGSYFLSRSYSLKKIHFF